MEKKIVDQKEYLKKYLSSGGDHDKKKKKKKKLKVGSRTVKIIDDDIDLKNMRPIEDNEFDIFMDTEDAPQIAGIIDDRGPVDFSDKKRWRIIADDEGGDLTITSHDKENIKSNKNHKTSKITSEDDLSPPRKQTNDSDDDLSPPRVSKSKKKKKDRTKRAEYDSDLSPPRKQKSSKDFKRNRKSSLTDSDSSSEHKSRKSKKKAKRKEKKYDSDLSPPRKSKNYDSDLSPPRRKKNEDSDLSPPRKSKNYDSDLSPPRKSKKYDSDLSPPRRSKHNDSDLSPPRRSKHNDSDLSPPRRRRKNDDSDLSPPRKSKNYDSDLSPPRKAKKQENVHRNSERDKKHKIPDRSSSHQREPYDNARAGPSSARDHYNHSGTNSSRKGRKEWETDLSPPRRNTKDESSHVNSKQRYANDPELSPPRQRKHHTDSHMNIYRDDKSRKYSERNTSRTNKKDYDSDLSPPRKKNKDSNRNLSPSSRFRESSTDMLDKYKRTNQYENSSKYSSSTSSSRREKTSRWNSENKRSDSRDIDIPERHDKRMKKTLDGKTAGLQDAKALREETEAHKKREAELFSKLSKEVSGVGQAAILRDSKTGRRRNLEAEAAAEREKQKRQDELDEKYAKWGRGLKQVEDREEKLKDDLYEMSKPLARYADDADLDKQLREQEREGDPMLEYIKQKQIKEGKRKPDGPRYEGSFMPNRFGIKPGHRWDGVDRSNGYEKKWFDAQNAKIARQEEAYKWSTSDM